MTSQLRNVEKFTERKKMNDKSAFKLNFHTQKTHTRKENPKNTLKKINNIPQPKCVGN